MIITNDQGAANRLAHCLFTAALLIVSSSAVRAELIETPLEFTSEDQSMWGTGDAFQLNETNFYGATWDESGSAGGFVGSDTTLNPLWVLWAGSCEIVCIGDEPTKFIDTRSGLEVTASTEGRVGFELGITIDSGSVDAVVDYSTQLTTPEPGSIDPGEFVSLNQSSTLTGESLESQFPTMSASLAVVLEVSASFDATGCLVGACDSVGFDTGTLGGTQELISFNEDGEGGIVYGGGSGLLSDIVDAAVATGAITLPTGFPAEIEIPAPGGISNLATITAHLPQPNTSGGLNAAGTMLTSTAQDDLLDLSLDVDNILSVALTGVGGLFGGGKDLGLGFSVSWDLINVEMGPQLNLVQSFEFTPTLFVDLEFSNPVNVTGYGWVTSLAGLVWDSLPTMAFEGGETLITPTFYLGANIGGQLFANAGALFNQLFLDIDGNVRVDLLTATFGTPFGSETIGIGNLFNHTFDVFTTPALFASRFAMVGFDPILGDAFTVKVPAPGTLLLLFSGLLLVGAARRRRSR